MYRAGNSHTVKPRDRQTLTMTERKTSKSGQETKDRIIDATLATIGSEGLVGTSARAIAKTGDFNQALIFYHFGSVDELLLAALERANVRRMARFDEQLRNVSSIAEFVTIARELHAGAYDTDASALSAIVAGWSMSSDLGARVLATLDPWNELVETSLRRLLEAHPLKDVLPVEQLAYSFGALFLGLEVMGRLDPSDERTDAAFAALFALATLADPLLNSVDLGALGLGTPRAD